MKRCRSGCPHPDIYLHTKMIHCSMDIYMPIYFVLLNFYFMHVNVGMRATRPTVPNINALLTDTQTQKHSQYTLLVT